jgi:hypothetical protein
VGRLDDIIARNQNPRKHRKMKFPVGMMLSAFVLLVLILMIFTDLGVSPAPKQDAPAADPSAERRVDGVMLYREPARVSRDAAADGP